MSRWSPALVLAVAMATLASACGPAPSIDDEPASLSGKDLTGVSRNITDYEGEVVIVTVWASWCAPCRDEAPVFARALDRLGADGLRLVGINFRDNVDAASQFVADEGIDYPSIVDVDGSRSVAWGVRMIPQSFLVDRAGKVVERLPGPATDEWIDTVVAEEVRR